MAERLRAIGLPPLSPTEGPAVHIHEHLDLYVDGRKVPVPAGIGIDSSVGGGYCTAGNRRLRVYVGCGVVIGLRIR